MSETASLVAEQERRQRQRRHSLYSHRLNAALEGREMARRLFEQVGFLQAMNLEEEDHPIPPGEHKLNREFARGFVAAFLGVLHHAQALIPIEDRDEFAFLLAEDLCDQAQQTLTNLGDEWVSPWMLYADKLEADGHNGTKLRFLTLGLYRKHHEFDCGRCLTGLDEEFRVAALAMLDSFSRHGHEDLFFVGVAQTLLARTVL